VSIFAFFSFSCEKKRNASKEKKKPASSASLPQDDSIFRRLLATAGNGKPFCALGDLRGVGESVIATSS